MKIREAAEKTSVSRPAIRYYESLGLMRPSRQDNSYREYSEEDIRRLRKISALRRIGIPLNDIRLLIDGTGTLPEVLNANIAALNEKIQDLSGAVQISRELLQAGGSFESFDESACLQEIHDEERQGRKFAEVSEETKNFNKAWIRHADDMHQEYRYSRSTVIAVLILTAIAAFCWYLLFLRH